MSAPTKKRPSSNVQRWRVPSVCLVLAAITFAVFGQTLTHDFVNFDDDLYVYENPMVARGLTLKGIVWAFTQSHVANWHPLTWLSHMLDCQLYGLHPAGHHLTNILLHTATVIALFLVLRQMTGALWRSAFVAAVFAIHPLRVESVAWVAERKDVLSGLFFMLTIGAYVRYARPLSSPNPNPNLNPNHNHQSLLSRSYLLVLLLFAMGLMCKPMLVTLPVVLLLLDYWPLKRKQPAGKLVLEKLPLLALSAASCVATLLAQTQGNAIHSGGSFSLPDRLANALAAGVIYLRQMLWPSDLAALYPYPLNGLPSGEVMLAGLLLAGVTALAFWQRRKRPWLFMGWFWYLVMLLPVAGIIQAGLQAHADRYTYLSQIGIYIAVTWLVAQWLAKRQANRMMMGSLMAGVIGVLMVCAWKQTAFWANSETLWTRTLACTTDNYVAHGDLGNALYQMGKLDEAFDHFQKAVQIKPGSAEAHANLGGVLLQMGRVDESIAQYQTAVQIAPNQANFQYGLGSAFFRTGKIDDAILQFQKALQINPDFAEACFNLGAALGQKGKGDEAIAQYQRALQIKPDYADARNNLGNILRQKGQLDGAIAQFQMALQIQPGFAEACFNLGLCFDQQGRLDEAVAQFQKFLQIKPDHAVAHYVLGNVLLKQGKVDEAIAHFQKAMQIKPGFAEAHNKLGLALYRKGNEDEAISQLRIALQIRPDYQDARNNLGWILYQRRRAASVKK